MFLDVSGMWKGRGLTEEFLLKAFERKLSYNGHSTFQCTTCNGKIMLKSVWIASWVVYIA